MPPADPARPTHDEVGLIGAAKRGEVEAFNQLVLRCQDLAYTVAYRILGERDAAADAAQDGFIAAYRKLHQFQGERFRPWLLRIVTNACYDELRRRQRRPAASLEALEDAPPAAEIRFASDSPSPEQHVQQAELSRAIQRCINALPDDQRVICVLADVEGYAYGEITEITGLPLGTVKSRLSRARGRLRACLQAVRELLPAEYRLVKEE